MTNRRAAGLLRIAAIGLVAVPGVSVALTIPLMRRRAPGSPDTPADFGLPFEPVRFPSRDGVRLGGWWIPAPAAPRGTVILCPGQRASMNDDLIHAVPLHRAGFNVLMFDFRAHGLSGGTLVTFGALERRDLLGALDMLAKERGVMRAGVLGFSMGAGVALLVAAQDARVATLVVDGAFPRLAGLLQSYLRLRGVPGPLAGGFAQIVLWVAALRAQYEIHHADPITLADRISAPTLFVHGERDPFVRTDEVRALAARVAGPAEVWSLADCGHREANKRHPDEYNQRVVSWFARHLANGKGTLSQRDR